MFSRKRLTSQRNNAYHPQITRVITSLTSVKLLKLRHRLLGATVVFASLTFVASPAHSADTTPTTRVASIESAIANVSKAASIVNRKAPLSMVRRGPATVGYVTVVLDEQTTYVYSPARRLIATLPVSTGLDDTTPTGSFKVFSKSADTFYTPNPRERMRWMTRFTKGPNGGNIGFHSIPYMNTNDGEVKFPTPIGLAPSSHGCVRMRDADAQWLFDNITLGTVVTVVKSK
jgi:lipoprotein-anchoring transpeptidase ErfK/SrfK